MSAEWFAAADEMLINECKNIDVIITTALIPGRKAPVLIKKAMVEAMPSGAVIIDLAAASGGNCETTVPGQVTKHGAVTIVGYTNIESRMASTASSLFGGNVSNFLLSMEDKKSKDWVVNLEDPAVRSICVALKGEALSPYVPPAAPVAAPVKETPKAEVKVSDPQSEYLQSALATTAGTTTALALASYVPHAPMMTTFALSCWVGEYKFLPYYYTLTYYTVA